MLEFALLCVTDLIGDAFRLLKSATSMCLVLYWILSLSDKKSIGVRNGKRAGHSIDPHFSIHQYGGGDQWIRLMYCRKLNWNLNLKITKFWLDLVGLLDRDLCLSKFVHYFGTVLNNYRQVNCHQWKRDLWNVDIILQECISLIYIISDLV